MIVEKRHLHNLRFSISEHIVIWIKTVVFFSLCMTIVQLQERYTKILDKYAQSCVRLLFTNCKQMWARENEKFISFVSR